MVEGFSNVHRHFVNVGAQEVLLDGVEHVDAVFDVLSYYVVALVGEIQGPVACGHVQMFVT